MKIKFLVFAILSAISFVDINGMGIWYVKLGKLENKSSGFVGVFVKDPISKKNYKYNINPRTMISLEKNATIKELLPGMKLEIIITGTGQNRFHFVKTINPDDTFFQPGETLNFKVKKNFKLKLKTELE